MRIRDPTVEKLRRIFEPYGATGPYGYWAIQELLENEIMKLSVDTFSGDWPNSDWIDKHENTHEVVDPAERRQHVAKKIIAAQYLSRRGHDVPTKPVPDATPGEKLFVYTGMEELSGGFRADVACSESCCETVVEAGFTPPKRALKAFGYTTVKKPETAPEHDQPTTVCVRTESRNLDAMAVVPYKNLSEDGKEKVYTLEPVTLPEPKTNYTAQVTGRAFEEHDE